METAQIRKLLKSFQFKALFNELGWDNHAMDLPVTAFGETYPLAAVAEKRGMVAFVCAPNAAGQIPPYRTRRKIEQQVARSVREHIIIYVDTAQAAQVWQWVRREKGRPTAAREVPFLVNASGDLLIQKLHALTVEISEEDKLTLTLVTGRARQAFDVEVVTKRFYDRFKAEHARFLGAIQSADLPVADREWYASVMLNRLMFLYFIQKKGFLAGDDHYLQHRLAQVQKDHGQGRFFTFYRQFLMRLFHEGLGQPAPRDPELERLIGKVPYLNGGLFTEHEIERRCRERGIEIGIADAAFKAVFDFFDEFDWHLDNRARKSGNEINPDVLGYIFEKYINQKEMGAYYTKEDITEYISRNTILPFLLDAAHESCRIAFEGEHSVWRCLREDPDRYLFPAVRHGMDHPLPPTIEAGIADVAQRGDWNRSASAPYALPTETWREVVARRLRCQEVRGKLASGEIQCVNDLVTYNLDIRRFISDLIVECEGPDLLHALWKALESMRVLDPTVGSGAFLFAALNILEPLYEDCLGRMEAFVGDADRAASLADHVADREPGDHRTALSGGRTGPEGRSLRFPHFREILDRVNAVQHPNRAYFIFKSIIVNNLFGVDIMEEATEICKLRLFLKLVAQVEPDANKANMGIEPLPDVDFNIRAGNTLVGYVNEADMDRLWIATGQLPFDRDPALAMKVRAYSEKLADFRRQQLGLPTPYVETKTDVERAANLVRPGLNNDLWHLYKAAGKLDAKTTQKQFLASHSPFHWFVEFPEVMAHGGFDVIIGNPPYVEYAKKDAKTGKSVKDDYKLLNYIAEPCGDLYAFVLEEAYRILQNRGRVGVIVPISIFGTDGFAPLQQVTLNNLTAVWVSSYANRPSQLFDGAQKRLTILLGERGIQRSDSTPFTAGYIRWVKEEFEALFDARVQYASVPNRFCVFPASLEKIGTEQQYLRQKANLVAVRRRQNLSLEVRA